MRSKHFRLQPTPADSGADHGAEGKLVREEKEQREEGSGGGGGGG